MLTNVVPTFTGMYENLGVDCRPTAAIVDASDSTERRRAMENILGFIVFVTIYGQLNKEFPLLSE